MPQDRRSDDRELVTETAVASADWTRAGEIRVPGLTVLYHPQLDRVGERALLPLQVRGRALGLSRLEPAFAQPGESPGEPLRERHLSRKPLHVERASEDSLLLRRGECASAVEIDGTPLGEHRYLSRDELDRGCVLLLARKIVLLLHRLDPLAAVELPRFGLVGDSPAMLELRRRIQQVADLDVPVLLRGETGTGKELVAQAIHWAGPRRERPMVSINLAAIPASLAAAELFGAAKGAFTGADRRRTGHFERADGGTLFLDEIGEAPAEVQVLLLRCLESGEVQPVGAERPQRIDVRVVSATDADLEGAVEKGRFRSPLLYRLGGAALRLPPLRERREDFGRLLRHFLFVEIEALGEEAGTGAPPWLSARVVARLARHDWPGNVRQLRNAVRQLVIACRGLEGAERDTAVRAWLADLLPASSAGDATPIEGIDAPARKPAEIGEDELLAALRRQRFRLQATADDLGISRASLYNLIDRSDRVRKASDLSREEIDRVRATVGDNVERLAEALEVSAQALRRRLGQLY